MTDLPQETSKGSNLPKAARLSAKMRLVLEQMAETGCDLKTAALDNDMNIQAAQRAFRRAHVKVAFRHMVSEIRENAGQAAYLRINRLSQTTKSDKTALDANKWLAGVDGISPVQKVQGQHHISHSFGGFDYGGIGGAEDDQSPAIDGQATDITPKKSER